MREERQRHRQREKQAPHREPDVGLDPGTPGSHPEPKAGAKLLSHPGIPKKLQLLRLNAIVGEPHPEGQVRERVRDSFPEKELQR